MGDVAWLSRAALEVFKEDRRSRVWRVVDAAGDDYVVKLFTDSRLKQTVMAWAGRHPAQLERQWHARLAEQGVAVVPIVDYGVDKRGQHWQVSPYAGVSLYNWLRQMDPASAEHQRTRRDLGRSLGRLVARLLAVHVTIRDFKASNLVVGTDGVLRVIDAGSARGGRGVPALARALSMLTKVHANLQDAAGYHTSPEAVRPGPVDRARVYRALVAAFDGWPPDGMQYLPGQEVFKLDATRCDAQDSPGRNGPER